MPEIAAFKGYRYNAAKTGPLKEVLAPPYDVISKEQQEALYQRHPHNFVRLDLKKKTQENEDIYSAAARELGDWISKGVFAAEPKPAIYVYRQTYKNQEGKTRKRIGFITLMRIDQKKVKKHEKTLTGPKVDRAALMESLRANMSPIFGLFEDPGKKVHSRILASLKRKPAVDVDIDGVRHELFVEDDERRIADISKKLEKKAMYIADGHHRFEVSSQYHKKYTDPRTPEGAGGRYVMTYLCAAEHNDLTIFPTHRALSLDGDWARRLESILAKEFRVTEAASFGTMMKTLDKPSKKTRLGLAYRPAAGARIRFVIAEPKRRPRELDVIVADRILIRPLIGEDVAASGRVRYSRDGAEALGWVEGKQVSLGIFLAKMPIHEIIRVSNAGINLPQKSTYFYPKLLSGLVFYKF